MRKNSSTNFILEKNFIDIKQEKGITLVALVITIIILIILSTITINMAFGDNGLIEKAELARDLTLNSTSYGEESIDNLTDYMQQLIKDEDIPTDPEEPETPISVIEAKESGEAFSEKTTVQDVNGNQIKVPAGFKIASDSGNTVQEGIVIEDVSASTDTNVIGSQYVWIPVGTFKKDDNSTVEIILGRYTFSTSSPGTPHLEQAAYEDGNDLNYTNQKLIDSYFIELSGAHRDGNESNGQNATAKDLAEFVASVKENGGYYIGRYEARDGETDTERTDLTEDTNQITLASNNYIYNYVTQPQAASLSQEMYNDDNFESDLMNSYAWDTAVYFLQKCDDRKDKSIPYSKQTGVIPTFAPQGTNNLNTKDIICNIYDMASNCIEFTTETADNENGIVMRGGGFNSKSNQITAARIGTPHGDDIVISFRPVLYLNY